MYSKPGLERFGTFRELTRVGFNGASDGLLIVGPDGVTVVGIGCDLQGCTASAS
jgi:hypothetical protein